MTKEELKKYAGLKFYNLSQRSGGMWATIHYLVEYEVTERGTCRCGDAIFPIIANKAQYEMLETFTGGLYHSGRPTAETLTEEFLDKVKEQADRAAIKWV